MAHTLLTEIAARTAGWPADDERFDELVSVLSDFDAA